MSRKIITWSWNLYWDCLYRHSSLTLKIELKVKVFELCGTLWDPIDYTVYGILLARILEWVAFPFSRGSSQPRDQTQVSRIAGGFFTNWAIREALRIGLGLPLFASHYMKEILLLSLYWSESHSVVSDSLWPHGLHNPWNSPGQNTGVGRLSLLQWIFLVD